MFPIHASKHLPVECVIPALCSSYIIYLILFRTLVKIYNNIKTTKMPLQLFYKPLHILISMSLMFAKLVYIWQIKYKFSCDNEYKLVAENIL